MSDSPQKDSPQNSALVGCVREGNLATLTIRRPDVSNCMSFDTLTQFRAHAAALALEKNVRAVIITGEGAKAFCAGADLKERATMPIERVPLFVESIRALMDEVEALPMPTIAAINGFAFGGGTELLLACDLRIAASTATLGLTEVTLAIIPGAGGTQRLPRLIGRARAKELILTGRRIGADEAARIGLVHEVVAPDELIKRAKAVAGEIAQNGPLAVRAAKRAVDRGCEMPLDQGLRYEFECYQSILPTKDRVEALKAFAEKRKPVFRGE
ncbi:MAG: enoyl-CoA hydratase/isomerase family protein [Planctomycetes bacterium]|nr:enoyl-CoA hydratase/isomerase family protein [Planctomycetota bacterium]